MATTNSAENGRTDRASRVIRASQECLYRAFLDPDELVSWLPPAGMDGRIEVFEPVVGGRFRMTLTYRDVAHAVQGKSTEHSDVVEGRFVELVPNQRITQSFVFRSDRPELAGPMIMTWSLAAAPGGTEVTVVCDNVPEAIRREDHLEGFRSTLQNLAAHTE
jgi:uncharacterized protein YndB with AHSA1/START domain